MKNFLKIIAFAVLFSSCNEYQKALKTDDVAVKLATATNLFEKKKYAKAITLFEQIAPAYKGKPQAEKLFYMMSMSYYQYKQYGLSAYQFESFASSYPKSDKKEEAAFLGAKSYSMMSPSYSLDQVDTDKAIDKLQQFIDAYPDSQYFAEANIVMKNLKNKLELKAFENAKQYNLISDHKAAMIALDNFISDYPGTPYKEDALFYKFDSAYQLAINSVVDKMEARLLNAKALHNNLVKFNAETKYKNKATEMLARIELDLKQFSK